MNDDVLKQQLDDGVLTLTLNRPERLNSLDQALLRKLVAATRNAAMDPAVYVVVLAGAGRGFCAGGDMQSGFAPEQGDPLVAQWAAHPMSDSPEQQLTRLRRNTETGYLLHTMPKPTIASVRGPAAGAGVCLAAACDLRIVSETATFTPAFTRVGFSGDHGGSYLLTHLLGPARAREYYLLGDRITAQEALRIGLVTRVVADAVLEAETMALARRLADGPRIAHGCIKQNLNLAETASFAQVLEQESQNMIRTRHTADAKEAGLAFLEKRAPKFQGS